MLKYRFSHVYYTVHRFSPVSKSFERNR